MPRDSASIHDQDTASVESEPAASGIPVGAAARKKRRKNRFLLTIKKHKYSRDIPRDDGSIPAYVARHLRTDGERAMYRITRKAAETATRYKRIGCKQRKEAKLTLKSLHAHFNVFNSQFLKSWGERQRMQALEDVLWRSCLHMGIRYEIGTAMQQLELLEAEIDSCKG